MLDKTRVATGKPDDARKGLAVFGQGYFGRANFFAGGAGRGRGAGAAAAVA